MKTANEVCLSQSRHCLSQSLSYDQARMQALRYPCMDTFFEPFDGRYAHLFEGKVRTSTLCKRVLLCGEDAKHSMHTFTYVFVCTSHRTSYAQRSTCVRKYFYTHADAKRCMHTLTYVSATFHAHIHIRVCYIPCTHSHTCLLARATGHHAQRFS
jgi:hypothetical protein